jgi:predicted dienelactone hydrolase
LGWKVFEAPDVEA